MTLKKKQAEMQARMKALEITVQRANLAPALSRSERTEQASAKTDPPRNALVEGPATRKCETCGRVNVS